jgi:cobalt-zinc-cadmium efflux system protein
VVSAPEGLDLQEVADAIAGVDGVEGAHHLHAWLLDEHRCALEAHVVIPRERAQGMDAVRAGVRRVLEERFGIQHSTLELEFPDTAEEAGHDRRLVPGG